MQKLKFEYKTKISYTNFIAPVIGLYAIYQSLTNTAGLAYKGKLVLPYPTSSYFFAFVGIIMILPLIYVYIKSMKKTIIEFEETKLNYTKGMFVSKNVTIHYKDIKEVSYEDDDDEGSSIIIDTGKIFNPKFYAKKFKSNSDFIRFCDEINKVISYN